MNKRLVINILGKILMLEALFMLLPLGVAFYYRESFTNVVAFSSVIIGLLAIGLIITRDNLPSESTLGIKDGFGVVALSWMLMSFFGSLPFVISGQIPNMIDAIFETASGFTTTGASIIVNVEELSHSMLFWRSFTHFIGGMGILVFALAVLPKSVRGSAHIMKAEVPGPRFGKLVSKVDITAQILYKIYVVMTVTLIIILVVSGMPLFDSMIHAFGAAGTGGFSNKALSVGYYNNSTVDYVLAIAMLLFGLNFNLYYLLLMKRIKDVFRSEELRCYFAIFAVAVVMICFNIRHLYSSGLLMVRDVVFTVSSIMTTTGYATADFNKWPLFSHFVILLLMFVGACAGSTAGGIKVSRILILFKSGINELKQAVNPRRVMTVTEDNRSMPKPIVKSAHIYLSIYIGVFAIILFIVSIDTNEFSTAFSAVAATLNNIGPGLAAVGPTGNYANFSPLVKVVLTMSMIIGRLEIFPVLILFAPSTWRKR